MWSAGGLGSACHLTESGQNGVPSAVMVLKTDLNAWGSIKIWSGRLVPAWSTVSEDLRSKRRPAQRVWRLPAAVLAAMTDLATREILADEISSSHRKERE